MDDINSKTLDQIKLKVEEATDRIRSWSNRTFFMSGESIDWADFEYVCDVALSALEKMERLERELEEHRIVKCVDCKYWEGVDERTYAAWCPYVGRTTHCTFYCAEGKRKE